MKWMRLVNKILLCSVVAGAYTNNFPASRSPVATGAKKLFQAAAIHPVRATSDDVDFVPPSEQQQLQPNSEDVNDHHKPRGGMSLALTAVYFTVMAAKCALPATLSLLTSSSTGLTFNSLSASSSRQQIFARILFTSTTAIAVGKVLLGPVIDHYGGILSLQVALASLSILLAMISVSQTVTVFAICWILVDFIFSSCWAACINAIHQSSPKEQWAQQVARLAAAARTGNAVAFAVFASTLSYFQTRIRQAWRPVFLVSGVLQLVPLVLLTIYSRGTSRASDVRHLDARLPKASLLRKLRNKPPADKHAAVVTSPTGGPMQTLRRESARPEFWCHLLSRSLLMVFASFLLFVPTLMTQIYKASLSSAAQIGSLYAVGCLLSVTLGSRRYDHVSRQNKLISLVSLLGLATLSSLAQLGHMMGKWNLSLPASALSMFVWGFAFAVPFYIPPSLFALKRGGTSSSATIADVFDIGGFGLLAAFNGYVAGIDHALAAAWIPVFQMTTAAAAVALVALSIATYKE